MFEIIGYWTVTSVLLLSLPLAIFFVVYYHLNKSFNKETNYKYDLPFARELEAALENGGFFLPMLISAVLSAIFYLIGVNVYADSTSGETYLDVVFSGSDELATAATPFASWVMSLVILVVVVKVSLKGYAKFLMMRDKLDSKINDCRSGRGWD